jgi:hypothetical protein
MKEYILIHLEFKDKDKSYRQFAVTDERLQELKTQANNPDNTFIAIKHRKGTAYFECSKILEIRCSPIPIYV